MCRAGGSPPFYFRSPPMQAGNERRLHSLGLSLALLRKLKILFFFLHPGSQVRAGMPERPLLFRSTAAARKRLRCAHAQA
jgi:hypothetical protein